MPEGSKRLQSLGLFTAKTFFKNPERYLRAGFWYWDSKRALMYMGKKLAKSLNIKEADNGVPADRLFSVIHPDDRARLTRHFRELLNGQRAGNEFEARLLIHGSWSRARVVAWPAELSIEGKAGVIIGRVILVDTLGNIEKTYADIVIPEAISLFHVELSQPLQFYWDIGENFFFSLNREQLPFDQVLVISLTRKGYRAFINDWVAFIEGNDTTFYRPLELQTDTSTLQKFFLVTYKDTTVQRVYGFLINAGELELSLHKSSERWFINRILNLHRLAMFQFDAKGAFKGCNRSAEKLFERKLSEISDSNRLFRVLGNRFQLFDKLIANALLGENRTFEMEYVAPDGSTKYILFTPFVISEISSDIFVSARDVTRQVKECNALERIKEHHALIMDLNVALQRIDKRNELFALLGQSLEQAIPNALVLILSCNPADRFIGIEGVFGVKPKPWKGLIDSLGWNPVGRRFLVHDKHVKRLVEAKTPDFIPDSSRMFSGYLNPTAVKVIERFLGVRSGYIIGISDGTNLYGAIAVMAPSGVGRIEADLARDLARIAVVPCRAIFIRQQLDEQMLQLKERVKEKDQILELLNNEIRPPLNSILGFSRLQLQNTDTQAERNQLELIETKSSQVLELLNMMVDSLQIESDSLTVVKAPCDIVAMLKQLCRKYRNSNRINEWGRIAVVLPEQAELLELFTDEGRLEQALETIIESSIRFFEKGHLELGYAVTDKSVDIFVRVFGYGMDQKVIDLTVSKIQHIDEVKFSDASLFGLNLSMDIIGQLDASVSVRAIDHGGVEFLVRFPGEHLATPEGGSVLFDEKGIGADFKNRVILIVEDEEVNYMVLNEMLQSWGATTLWAKNGREAVALVQSFSHTIHAILMDIRMPVMDGYAATMEIKQINREIPIIAQTAYASTEDRLKAEAAGCDGYIAKPIEPDVLAKSLEMVL